MDIERPSSLVFASIEKRSVLEVMHEAGSVTRHRRNCAGRRPCDRRVRMDTDEQPVSQERAAADAA
jgi:hypothetical protein